MTTTANHMPWTKITLRLPADVIRTTEEAVSLGLAVSTTRFIEDAIRARMREVRHARLRHLAKEAVADPGFIADMEEIRSAFATAQTDGWARDASSNRQ